MVVIKVFIFTAAVVMKVCGWHNTKPQTNLIFDWQVLMGIIIFHMGLSVAYYIADPG
jgi:hypothetical protein